MAFTWGALLVAAVLAAVSHAAIPAIFPESAQLISRHQARIVSGWEAEEGQFPFQLSIRMVNTLGGVSSCGGSIIHEQWGLTAAHCTATRETFIVRAGTVNLTRPAAIFEVTTFYNHPLYDNSDQGTVQPHDIGLLRLDRTLTFTDRVQPIRLQRSVDMNRDYTNAVLTAAGWGLTWTGGTSPENMNWVLQRGISNWECMVSYGNIIVSSTICTRFYNETTQSTCSGDSGGTLTVVDEDGLRTLVGVTSFVGSQGCHVDSPKGFIRPGHYHGWFTEVTGINFDWDFSTTTEAPETTITTEAPETTITTEAPETTITTEAPETTITTEAPETTITTEAPETTTAADSSEENSDETSSSSEEKPSSEEKSDEESSQEKSSQESSEEKSSEEQASDEEERQKLLRKLRILPIRML